MVTKKRLAVTVIVVASCVFLSFLLLIVREHNIKLEYRQLPKFVTTDLGKLAKSTDEATWVDKATIYPSEESFHKLAKSARRAWLVRQTAGGAISLKVYLEIPDAPTLYACDFLFPDERYDYFDYVVAPSGSVVAIWKVEPYADTGYPILKGLGWLLIALILCFGCFPFLKIRIG